MYQTIFQRAFCIVLAFAALLGSSTASAATVSATMQVTGNVVGEASISTGNLDLGSHTKIEFNDGRKFDHTFVVNVTDGLPYSLCVDTPNSVAWNLDGGTAKNVSVVVGQEVKLKAWRSDGTTPMTPASCWNRIGTGSDENVPVKFGVDIGSGFTGIGQILSTLAATLVY